MLLVLMGGAIGKLVRRVMLALVEPPVRGDVPPEYYRFPLW